MNSARSALGGAGIQTSALAFGGGGAVTTTELYNGTSWTSNPTGLATGRQELAGAGTQIAGLAFGGETATANTAATEEFTGPGSPVTKTITTS
jgi:hypothetical protein